MDILKRTPQQIQEIERMANCLLTLYTSLSGCRLDTSIPAYIDALNTEYENDLSFKWDGSRIFVIQL